MYEVKINMKQLQEVKDAMGKSAIEKTLDLSIKKSIVVLNREAIKEAPINNGRLRGGFQTTFGSLYGRLFNPVDYAIYVHDGTKPHRAPFSAIEQWAGNRGLPAGAIWHSIAMKGTKANPFMDRALESTEDQIDQIFQKEIDDLILRYNR